MTDSNHRSKKRQSRGLKTENKVLSVAERLLRENGFEAAQVNKIVEESGVSVGSFYHHFGSKEGVISRLVQRFCDEGCQQVDALDLVSVSADEALELLILTGMDRFRKNPELYRAMAARIVKEPEVWEPFRNLRAYHVEKLVEAVGPALMDQGIDDPRARIERMMQVFLALMTHIVIFDSGPVSLMGKRTDANVLEICRTILMLEPKCDATNERV